jgi:predicted phosphodiesterase
MRVRRGVYSVTSELLMVKGKARGSQPGLLRIVSAAGLGLGLTMLLLVVAGASGWQVFAMPVQADSSGGHYLPRAPAAVTLTRGPYLQSVATDSIIVVWETNTPAGSQVDYGPTTSYGLVVSSAIPVTHHALTLAGLGPYTLYRYRVSSDGQALGVESTFRSAAEPTQTVFSFVVFGDTAGTDLEAHQSVVNRIAALEPDFVLHNGDFVEDGLVAAQWTTFFTIEQALLRQSPLYGTLGNDDMSSTNYFDAFHLPGNESWYSFDYGNAHIVTLQIDDAADFGPGNAQFTWLDTDLANTDRQWKIVFFHVPPTPDALGTLVPILTKHSVDIVFSGHVHLYERAEFGGVMYVISGGGGEPLYPGPLSSFSAYYTSTYHCVRIAINGRSLTSVGVRPDGVEFDSFTLHAPLNIYLPLILSHWPGP